MWASIAGRLFWRELKRGELWVIAFALFLAVGSVVSLSGITQSVKSALQQRSAQFTAADRVLGSSQPFNENFFAVASQLNVATARQMQFDSMLFAGEQMQLATIKAVNDAYPLRGELLLHRSASITSGPTAQLVPGEVWFETRLLDLLQVKPGDTIELGESRLVVGGVIANEPDAPLSVFGGSPRVIMHLADVPASNIVQPGSRISYRYLFAGSTGALDELAAQLQPMLSVHQRWRNLDRESAIGSALERAERFLLLAGLLGIVLAACAAAVAASRYSQRHTQAVAIIKALGATTARARLLYGSHLFLVVLFSLVLGLLGGQLAIFAAELGISQYISDYRTEFSVRPLLLGTLTCIICALLFAARPLWQLAKTPAIEVLKQPAVAMVLDKWQLLFGAAAIWGLMWLFSGELLISVGLFLLCALFAGILLGFAAVMVKLARPVAAGQSSAGRLALANLRRRLWPNSFQLITFSLAIFLTLLLYFLRAELIGQWQQQIPEGAPNHFLVNVSAQQRTQVTAFTETNNLQAEPFYPVVRGRLITVNDEKLQQEASKEDRSEQRVGVGRELNLTWLADIPANNKIIEGQWFTDNTAAEVSVEQEIAERLQLSLGDTLDFSVGGQQVSATVTSIRQVDWNSLQPNFYMILSPDVLATFPATYITAFYLEQGSGKLINQLARQMPTVTVISVDAIITQVNDIIAQVTIALSFILVIIALAAALVLVAQVQATLEQREQELAILRTLGAKYVFLRNALLLEFAFLGALAGLFATVLAELLLMTLQQRVFDMPFQFHFALWWMGPAIGVVSVSLLGWWQLRRLLQIPGAVLIRRVIQS
ncbi:MULTISPECIES: ABC transporter permease [unclassified Arsukibacterium]|uniref:ABC transporter permease n=1 Tax=unclassified Arsukibacterium TaxID=2635278 RepID=UPI000C912649|nr:MULTISPECIES: FtsX-like permease family protein [unclassified Arsukibacterium]MAA96473.1 ABC transporter permease [Rheinheimera sp.]HAW94175.1 ABC transporter permease [Candidatus Azambacteria bacterium]|tara:strand:+ start:1644 stop:4130 length:2487 start_codon:yes stop_codon:yes gene_type:complete